MNKVLNKLGTIIVINIVVISIITISNNFEKALQNRYYLNIDLSNREYIEEILIENKKIVMGEIHKIAYQQGLGDWELLVYYENGIEDKIIFGDSNRKMQPLQDNIIQNGYNECNTSSNKVKISLGGILIAIIYGISYLIIKKIKRKQREMTIL